jgi:hypothetical protein
VKEGKKGGNENVRNEVSISFFLPPSFLQLS